MILPIIQCFEYEIQSFSVVFAAQNPKIMHGTTYQKHFWMLANDINNFLRDFKKILLTLSTISTQ